MAQQRTSLFISYKTGATTGLTFQARAIRKELVNRRGANYHVFFDKESLEAGLDWNQQIYRNIPRSDVLLLLLAEETVKSDWVRREIDVAKGAQVTILPVLIRDFDGLQEALDKLDLPRLQAVTLTDGSEEQYEKLFAAIEARKSDTATAQRKLLQDLDRGPQLHPVSEPDRDHQVVTIGPPDGPALHLAAGNILAMKGIDVFVNSENNFMQMARVFDDRTVSSLLRYHGARFNGAGQLLDDTVQEALTQATKKLSDVLPLGLGTVVVTRAGHKQSRLAVDNQARYIFHTAVVAVQDNKDGTGKELGVISDQGLMDAVRATLMTVAKVNSGQVLPPEQHDEPATAPERPIESIIFPLLGTGRGGLTAEKVANLMVRAIKGYLADQPQTTLKRIYLCAYSEEDVLSVKEAFAARFQTKPPGVVEPK